MRLTVDRPPGKEKYLVRVAPPGAKIYMFYFSVSVTAIRVTSFEVTFPYQILLPGGSVRSQNLFSCRQTFEPGLFVKATYRTCKYQEVFKC